MSRVVGGAEGGARDGVSEAQVGAHKGVHPGGGRELRHSKYTVSKHKHQPLLRCALLLEYKRGRVCRRRHVQRTGHARRTHARGTYSTWPRVSKIAVHVRPCFSNSASTFAPSASAPGSITRAAPSTALPTITQLVDCGPVGKTETTMPSDLQKNSVWGRECKYGLQYM